VMCYKQSADNIWLKGYCLIYSSNNFYMALAPDCVGVILLMNFNVVVNFSGHFL